MRRSGLTSSIRTSETGQYRVRYEELLSAYAMWSRREILRLREGFTAVTGVIGKLTDRVKAIEAKFDVGEAA